MRHNCKLNRQRSVLPSDTVLLKALYLFTFKATKKWIIMIRNWARVYGELSIMYEGRIPKRYHEMQGIRPAFLTYNHCTVIYKSKEESLFISLPPFITIEDLSIYRVFFIHSDKSMLVIGTS